MNFHFKYIDSLPDLSSRWPKNRVVACKLSLILARIFLTYQNCATTWVKVGQNSFITYSYTQAILIHKANNTLSTACFFSIAFFIFVAAIFFWADNVILLLWG